jgi:hypothetical protein
MLKGLDKIDWSSLKAWHGKGEKVPTVIRAFTSDDPEIRAQAPNGLIRFLGYYRGEHRSVVYEVAVYAMPFLIELLQEKSVQEREKIVHVLPWFTDVRFGEYAEAARAVVLANTSVFLNLLFEDEMSLRRSSLYLLRDLKENSTQIIPVLLKLLQEDRSEIQGDVIRCLFHLTKPETTYVGLFEAIMRDSAEHRMTRFVAAISAAELQNKQVSDELVDFLLDSLANSPAYENDVYPVDFGCINCNTVVLETSQFLASIRADLERRVADVRIQRMKRLNGFELAVEAKWLVNYAFNHKRNYQKGGFRIVPQLGKLTEIELMVLTAIAAQDSVWEDELYHNLKDLPSDDTLRRELSYFLLPDTQESLRAFLNP